tara:strand:+ start:87 stop:356 length:270 start_codon:yes stop_codon:yes gene_type:complete
MRFKLKLTPERAYQRIKNTTNNDETKTTRFRPPLKTGNVLNEIVFVFTTKYMSQTEKTETPRGKKLRSASYPNRIHIGVMTTKNITIKK